MKKFVMCVLCSLVCFNFMVLGCPIIATANLNEGLIAYWSFDDCDVLDESGNGHDGYMYGDLSCVEGIRGKGFKFDGQSYIDVSNSGDLSPQDYTVIVFYKANNTGFLGEILTKGIDKHYYQIQFNSNVERGTIECWYEDRGDGDHYILVEDGFDTEWHMIGMSFNSTVNELRAYLDGELVDKKRFIKSPYDNGGELWIGRGNDGYFKGIIDEIFIYDRVLDDEEIESLYNEVMSGENCDEDLLEKVRREGFEAGKQYCIQNPSACGITDRYEEGIEKGKELCREDPSTCGIDLECENNDNSMCEASFNLFTNTLHIPCLRMGDSYWLDLSLISSDPVQLEMSGFGKNE